MKKNADVEYEEAEGKEMGCHQLHPTDSLERLAQLKLRR